MWISDIESSVFTRLKAGGNKIKEQFPKLFYTTSNESDSEAVFPTVYLEELQGSEQGQTFDGKEVAGYLASFQINVTHNGSKDEARRVMDNALETMKSMRFDIVGTPFYTRSSKVWTGTARCRRMIGSGDSF